MQAAARRDAILNAALYEFSARGFADARLDDMAQRARVAKGTIYLHFKDKEALFEELVRAMLGPLVGSVEAIFRDEQPLRATLERVVDLLVREVFATRRRDIIRLIITEGPRFPQLAEIYYREVLARILHVLRVMLEQAHARGELKRDTVVRFPQLLAAPAVVAIVWGGLFDRFEPVDTRAMLMAQLDLIFAETGP